MNKLRYLAVLLFLKIGAQQPQAFNRAPNSYIFDPVEAKTKSFSGIFIPVKKAYTMWSSYQYLKKNDSFTPVPNGNQTASVIWEDVPGLIKNVSIVAGANPEDAKLKVEINKYLGNGNAVVSFKVDDEVYWTWHIWVTDDPSNGVTYTQGFETDQNNNLITVQYMDRNLGALSNTFLGHNWHKSGGLLYEWGRKDPFPPLVYKDLSFYEIKSEMGYLKHSEISDQSIPVVKRPFNDIEDNIRFSVNNPLHYIVNEDQANWFSDKLHKVAGSGTSFEAWDLWADNYKGLNGNANSSNSTIRADSRSYELKSELDPCPNGWRIPSYYGRVTVNNNLAPFGRKNSGVNDDVNPANNTFYPNAENNALAGVKVYPGLGIDFSNSADGNRNLGIISMSGHFEKYPNSVIPNAPLGVIFQDENADTSLWSATFGYDGARNFGAISDVLATTTTLGKHQIFINQTIPSQAGNAVKCMKDPNIEFLENFDTEFVVEANSNEIEGLSNPNTYLIDTERLVQIPVNKPFAVRNQLLASNEALPKDNLKAKVLWSTNASLVKSVSIIHPTSEVLESYIEVEMNPNQYGNFVVSLHNGSTTNPAYWSWYFWVPENNPTTNPIKYITEKPLESNLHFVNPTKSYGAPLITTMMDRNLGALLPYRTNLDAESARKTKGMLFQWGRKDPVPSFQNSVQQVIYEGDDNLADGATITYRTVNNTQYLQNYSKEFSDYNLPTISDKYEKAKSNIRFSIENPLTFLYQSGLGSVYDGGEKSNNDLNEIRDWVSDDRSVLAERWGHGKEKSPFDPCPAGWRVPDVFQANLYSGSKGNSPFYNSYNKDAYGKDGVIQDQWADVVQYYNGVQATDGWMFVNQKYPIGGFPADGIRGELGDNSFSTERSGIWTSSLADLSTGYALAMLFQGNKMQTGTGVYPQAALSVRCAKDEVRYLGVPVTESNTGGGFLADNPVMNPAKITVYLYPNPFVDELNVNSNDVRSYQIFDMNGKLLKEEVLNKSQINTSQLLKGMYVIKLVMKDNSVVTQKVLRK